MKEAIKLFLTDFDDFVRNNWKVLVFCLFSIFALQYFGKGNPIINLIVVSLHLIGDVMMIMSLAKFAQGYKKSSAIYLVSSAVFFIAVGVVAVLQSTENKNWQYLLGTAPFLIAHIYQVMDAWDIKAKRFFNYKLTAFVALVVAIIYYQMDLIYSYIWVQIIGYSLFPIFLGMRDSPKVYIGRVLSVFLMLIGSLLDVVIQFSTPGVVPAAALSSFFITLIALLGFMKNAPMYVKHVDETEVRTLKLLKLFSSI